MKKTTITILLIVLGGTGLIMAQPGGHGQGNPELRAEIRAYAQENIIPVIAKEREAFDPLLSDTEKEQIALAQGKRKVRRIMFKEWYKSEDFEPGARRDDPDFDKLREDMQKSMAGVRAIALAHDDEVAAAMSRIGEHRQQWEDDIRAIAGKYQNDEKGNFKAYAAYLRRIAGPVNFLMFNPDEAQNTPMFDLDRKGMVEVSLYPNPATSRATVRITGADGLQLQIGLFTKEGNPAKELFNGRVEGQEMTFGFSVAEMDNGIYLLKVKAGETVIARKLVVQK